MRRKLRTASLSLVAVFVMGALSANSASAGEWHSEVAHTIWSGEQHAGESTQTFKAGTSRCSHETWTGTSTTATMQNLTVTAVYTGCKAFGFINTTIDTNGCSYQLDVTAKNVDVFCPAGKAIVITAFNCYVTIGSQENIGTVIYTNLGAGVTRDVTVDTSLIGTKYTQESKSFPGCTNGTFTDGTSTGAHTLRGFNTENAQRGVWTS